MKSKKTTEREVISAKVTHEAAEGWRSFCMANGVSMSAMLEVAGLQLGKETFPASVPARREMVEMAREIDILRRARKHVK